MHDCLIDNYHNCKNHKTFKYLVKSGAYHKSMDSELIEIYTLISDQVIDTFGVSDSYALWYYKKNDILKMELKILNGDRSAITHRDKYLADLAAIERDMNVEEDLRITHARQHRYIQTTFQGRNSHTLTVFEFYNDISDINEIQEQKKKDIITMEARRNHG